MPQSRRSYVGLLAALLGGAMFLVVHPSIELDGHLRTVRDGDREATREALRRLCWLSAGAAGLNDLLPQLDIDRRALVLHEAQGLGCLGQLGSGLQAAYYLLETEEVERAVGHTKAAVKPALEILESGDQVQRARAARALALLRAHWSVDERARIEALLDTVAAGREVDALRTATGLGVAPRPPEPSDAPDVGVQATTQEEEAAGEPAADAGTEPEALVPALVPPTLAAPNVGVLYRRQQDSAPDAGAVDPDMGGNDD